LGRKRSNDQFFREKKTSILSEGHLLKREGIFNRLQNVVKTFVTQPNTPKKNLNPRRKTWKFHRLKGAHPSNGGAQTKGRPPPKRPKSTINQRLGFSPTTELGPKGNSKKRLKNGGKENQGFIEDLHQRSQCWSPELENHFGGG